MDLSAVLQGLKTDFRQLAGFYTPQDTWGILMNRIPVLYCPRRTLKLASGFKLRHLINRDWGGLGLSGFTVFGFRV